jgi:hypothetical protein
MRMTVRKSRLLPDRLDRTITQYRKLAEQAKINAQRAADRSAREWFLSLAKSMNDLAAGLEDQMKSLEKMAPAQTPVDSNSRVRGRSDAPAQIAEGTA